MTDEVKTIVGRIEDKQTKEGATNGKAWKRFMFKIGGESMSTFDTAYDEFKVGELAEVEYTVNGAYKNINWMNKSESLPPTTQETPIPPTPEPVLEPMPTSAPAKIASPTSYVDKERETGASIVSQVIIKACADMISSGKIEPGKLKENARVLVDVYKETKKTLLE